MRVFLGNKEITDGQIFHLESTQTKPKIIFEPHYDTFYTIMMVDPDAPSRENPKYKYVLHWLIINNNEEIMPFKPPSPPENSGLHRYFIYILKQKNKIKLDTEIKSRPNFKMSEFIDQYNLEIVDSIHFQTSNPS